MAKASPDTCANIGWKAEAEVLLSRQQEANVLQAFQIGAGIILGLGAIGGVFWFTFRVPPPRRPADSTTHSSVNRDVENAVQNFRDDGHGGHF